MASKSKEDRFYYLMTTFPWNLSKEDYEESIQLKRDVQPVINSMMNDIYDKYENRIGGELDG